jgi:alkanesulfonate monooxygenase SsuD/methylene tetrahydromethanopterin reductase-like flavin-dependent oxidoreductase (luciferase family)
VPPLLGASLAPETAHLSTILQAADEADRRGLDLFGVQDHPYQRRFVDTWTLLTAIGVRTRNLRIFADVTCLPLRPPAMLATAVATLDHLTGGRAELGLGAGGYWDAIAAMGGPRRTPGEAVEALEEALDVLDLMWSGERSVRYDGRHYQLAGTHPGPQPVHEIGRWIGAIGPRMLRLVGRRGTGWVPSSGYLPPDQLPQRIQIIEEAATHAGRDPKQIRRIYNVGGTIAGSGATAQGWFDGGPEAWVEQLVTLTHDVGMTDYVFWPAEDSVVQITRFGEEVAPAVREALGKEQSGSTLEE